MKMKDENQSLSKILSASGESFASPFVILSESDAAGLKERVHSTNAATFLVETTVPWPSYADHRPSSSHRTTAESRLCSIQIRSSTTSLPQEEQEKLASPNHSKTRLTPAEITDSPLCCSEWVCLFDHEKKSFNNSERINMLLYMLWTQKDLHM